MIVANWIVEKLIDAKDEAHLQAVTVILDAQKVQLASRDREIAFLNQHIADLKQYGQYEKARADAAIDRLLVRDAKVFPVAPAATAAMEAAKKESQILKSKVETIFESINGAGEDGLSDDQPTKITFPGGGQALLSPDGKVIPRPPKPEDVRVHEPSLTK